MDTLRSILRRAVLLMGGLAVAAVPLACDSGGPNGVETCTLSADSGEEPPLTVEYTATLTGDAEFTELTYATDDGEQTMNGVTSDWSSGTLEVTNSNVSIEISAEARLTSGSAEVGYAVLDADGNVVDEDSDNCDVNSD